MRGLLKLKNKFQFAKDLIYKAGDFVRTKMSDDIIIEQKSQFDDLVTNIDKLTQELIVSEIKSSYPNDAFIAEEGDIKHCIDDGNVWVIDPIDGTVNFIVQQSHFAIMLSYFENGVGQFAFIYNVMADELYFGGNDFGVYQNNKQLMPYQSHDLKRSLICSNSEMYADKRFGIYEFSQGTLGVRMYGGAGISMTCVLSGKAIAYFSYIQPWDYAAAMILGDSLGYCVLTLDGEKPNFVQRQRVMFIPLVLKDRILDYVNPNKTNN